MKFSEVLPQEVVHRVRNRAYILDRFLWLELTETWTETITHLHHRRLMNTQLTCCVRDVIKKAIFSHSIFMAWTVKYLVDASFHSLLQPTHVVREPFWLGVLLLWLLSALLGCSL